jgi:hypothetical protein
MTERLTDLTRHVADENPSLPGRAPGPNCSENHIDALTDLRYVAASTQNDPLYTACSYARNPLYRVDSPVELTFLEDYSVGQPDERIPPLGHGEGRSDEQYEEALLDT